MDSDTKYMLLISMVVLVVPGAISVFSQHLEPVIGAVVVVALMWLVSWLVHRFE